MRLDSLLMVRLSTIAAIALAVSGCATQTEPPSEWVRNAGPLSQVALPAAKRIVVESAEPLDTSSLEVTPADRERFEQARTMRVSQAAPRAECHGGNLCVLVLPIIIPAWMINAIIAQIGAENAEPKLIPAEESARLAALFRERVTGEALATRTARFLAPDPEASGPALVLRVNSIEHTRFAGDEHAITLRADAHFADAGGQSPRTSHFVMLNKRSVGAWTRKEYGDTRREIDQALDILAASIAATYRLGSVAVPKERVHHWGN